MKIDDALIDRLGTLSKLSFEGTERDKMKGDLSRMLDMIDKLSEIDTEGVEPLIHMTREENRYRPDIAASELSQAEVLKNAPSKDAYYFKVPRVISDNQE